MIYLCAIASILYVGEMKPEPADVVMALEAQQMCRLKDKSKPCIDGIIIGPSKNPKRPRNMGWDCVKPKQTKG